MPLSIFVRRITLLAACVFCLCFVLIASPLRAAPARNWPYFSRAVPNHNPDDTARLNETVRAVQYLLRARGYSVSADGLFGKNTDAAVRRFQRGHHLISDGVLQPPTWEALIVRVAPGASGPAVSAAQVRLRVAGYAVPVNGRFSPQMKAAVRKFQAQTGHAPDGIIGPATWSELMMTGNRDDYD